MGTGKDRYEDEEILNRYIWLHYDCNAGVLPEIAILPLWNYFQEVFKSVPTFVKKSVGVDLGCAVGRATFELSKKVSFAIGMDTSSSFIRKAEQIKKNKKITYLLKDEGEIQIARSLDLEAIATDNAEFILADATNPPLPPRSCDIVLSLNLLDRVNDPAKLLLEVDSLLKPGGILIHSDPYTWKTSYTPKENWLGGKYQGSFAGYAEENIRDILKGNKKVSGEKLAYMIDEERDIPFLIKEHRRNYTLVVTHLIKARKVVRR